MIMKNIPMNQRIGEIIQSYGKMVMMAQGI